MSNRKRHLLGKRIVRLALSGHQRVTITTKLQKRPYTAVVVTMQATDGNTYKGVGFTKVCWPDRWDPEYGIEIAVKKAAHDIARQMYADA